MTPKPSFGQRCIQAITDKEWSWPLSPDEKAQLIDDLYARESRNHQCSFGSDGSPCSVCGLTFAQSLQPIAVEIESTPTPAQPQRHWTEDFGHENGNYLCKCVTCGNEFKGHKRRYICKACSTAKLQGEWWDEDGYLYTRIGKLKRFVGRAFDDTEAQRIICYHDLEQEAARRRVAELEKDNDQFRQALNDLLGNVEWHRVSTAVLSNILQALKPKTETNKTNERTNSCKGYDGAAQLIDDLHAQEGLEKKLDDILGEH